MELVLFLNVKSKNAVKLASETREIPYYHAEFFSFWKSLQSWLDRLNTPLQ